MEDDLAWLRAARPDVDWSRVRVKVGLPWWALRGTAALVVPGWRRTTIRLGRGGRGVLLHEAEHVAQVQRMGPLRFALRYLALALRHGFGPSHPMERPAYEAGRRLP